jgi:GGDEF domain-containing protein
MLRSLAETLEVEGAAHHVSASIGIAFSGVNGEPLEPLIAAADRAMYQAKAQGPSNYSFA